MKTLINNTMKILTLAVMVFTVPVFSYAASPLLNATSFDPNPSDNTGITSIYIQDGTCAQDCGGIYSSESLPFLAEGDSIVVDVYTDYMTRRNLTNPVMDASVRYLTEDVSGTSETYTFTTRLMSSNAPTISDTVTLTDLPYEWTIEAIGGHIENTHGVDYPVPCAGGGSLFNYYYSAGNAIFSSAGRDLGDLSTQDGGWCAQGTAVVSYRITNTTNSGPANPPTWSVGNWGMCLGGIQERDVFCEDSNGNTVSSSLCDQSTRPNDTQSCAITQVLDVDTDPASNISPNYATLNGDLISGGPANDYWFMLSSTTTNPQCTGVATQVDANQIDSGSNPNFSGITDYLLPNTQYHYRACVIKNGLVASGSVQPFVTDGTSTPSNNQPDADTRSPQDVQEDSAEIRGSIDMNSFNNGRVFFVWGENENDVENVNNENSYAAVVQDGDDLRKETVDYSLNGNEDYELDIDGLDEDERHYYQICVEYIQNNGSADLICGGVEEFDTDNDSSNNDIDIRTLSPEDIFPTSAVLCGDLEDDGGDNSLRTNIEFRRSNGGSWIRSPFSQRGEGNYCVEVNNLQPNTSYQFRACTDENECGNVRNFVTSGTGGNVSSVIVNTLSPTAVGTNSAILNGRYEGSPNEPTQVWFEWGRTSALGTQKRVFTQSAIGGNFADSFTGLRPCTEYYYRAVARNSRGIKYGNTIQFSTSCIIRTGGPNVVSQPPVIRVVEQVEEQQVDLDLLGLGLSLIRLEIDNDQDSLFRDQVIQYEVRWENISSLDLDDIDLKISIPEEITVTNISRGRFDADENVVFYNIANLDEGEDGDMTISGIVNNGSLGDVVTAEASAAYNNPINDAQENATDYDIDEFVLNTNFGTASVFGLSNITFLGWLTIILGLGIVFLIARWLYLEREELRAQAYVGAYQQPALYADPRYDYNRGPQALGGYQQPQTPLSSQDSGPENLGSDDGYQPYRPNRS